LREDGLVTLGVQGIVYAEGSAGTVQEIFQDASQNFYNKLFSPMVFLSSSRVDGIPFWERKQPVRPLIMSLLGDKPDFPDKVLFTESADQALRFLEGSPRVSAQVLRQVRRSVASNRA
jgi:hypothetical protein